MQSVENISWNYLQYESDLMLKKESWFDENFVKTLICGLKITLLYTLWHSVEKWKIYSHWKNISSNQLFSDFVSKNVIFTEFLPKKCESKFQQREINFGEYNGNFCISKIPQIDFTENISGRKYLKLLHSGVEITEFFSHTFLAKLPRNQSF